MTKYTIAYKEEKEDGGFSGRCLELPAAISQGETLEELEANMLDAIQLVSEYLAAEVKESPKMIIEA